MADHINVRVNKDTNDQLNQMVASGEADSKADAIRRLLTLKAMCDRCKDEDGYYNLWLNDINIKFKV